MTKACGNCGKEMDDSAVFCPACGKAAAQADLPSAGDQAGGPAGGQAGGQAGEADSGLASNLAGALAYLWIVAIVFLVLEPYNRDKFVRFHSFQALFLGIAAVIVNIALSVIPIIGWALMPFWGLLVLAFGVIAAVKAYQGQTWMIPVIGPLARQQV